MTNQLIGLFGGSSFVGKHVLSNLIKQGHNILAFSRKNHPFSNPLLHWEKPEHLQNYAFSQLICIAPIWVLKDYLPQLVATNLKRIVALSSTSCFTKQDSSLEHDKNLAAQWQLGEQQLRTWAEQHGVEWVILRPTLIYELGHDKNISFIASLIQRFGVLPLIYPANGLRQPVHAEDVALACIKALIVKEAANKAYNLAGGETLTYKEMVERIFIHFHKKPHFIPLPATILKFFIHILRVLPRFKLYTTSMVDRINNDMVFNDELVAEDLHWVARNFLEP